MTLFTAEGLLRAQATCARGERADDVAAIRGAYLRWLRTQDASVRPTDRRRRGGWLVDQRRAPPPACARHHLPLGAVRRRPRHARRSRSTTARAAAASCGSRPIGLVAEHRFATAARAARSPTATRAGTCRPGRSRTSSARCSVAPTLPDAIDVGARRAGAVARPRGDHARRSTPRSRWRRRADVDAERIETLGGGWVGEEALAIGLYCALVAPDVRTGLLLAVNHSGDSDSTGSIAGNLLGALHGVDALPHDLLGQLEGRATSSRPWPAISPTCSSTVVRSTAPLPTGLSTLGGRGCRVR